MTPTQMSAPTVTTDLARKPARCDDASPAPRPSAILPDRRRTWRGSGVAGCFWLCASLLSISAIAQDTLRIDTRDLAADIVYQLVTPTDSLILTPVNGELRLPIDSTEAGQYALRATSDIASIDITVHFMHSSTGFQDVTVLRNDTLFPLDSTMFDVTGTNTLILHDGPDNRPGTSVPTHRLVLQNGIGITPNGDGQYDDLHFESTVPVTSYSLTISDKNGIMVFHSTDPDETWNGNMLNTGAPQPTGLYIYGLVFNDTTENGKFLLER